MTLYCTQGLRVNGTIYTKKDEYSGLRTLREALMEGARQAVYEHRMVTVEVCLGMETPIRGKIVLKYKSPLESSLPDLVPPATVHSLDELFQMMVETPVEGASPDQSQVVSYILNRTSPPTK